MSTVTITTFAARRSVELVVKQSASGTTPGDTLTVSAVCQTETTTTRVVAYSHGASITMNALQVAREAILALLDNRDFLGYQLSHAHGTISDEQMDGIVDEHFSKAGSFKEGDAARKAAFLAGIVPERFDAELLSTVLGCDIEQAEKAIAIAAKNLDKLLPEPSKLSGFVR